LQNLTNTGKKFIKIFEIISELLVKSSIFYDKRYFECENGYGIFVKADQPKKVIPKPGLKPIKHTKTSAMRTMKDGGDPETQSIASSTASSRIDRSPMNVPVKNNKSLMFRN